MNICIIKKLSSKASRKDPVTQSVSNNPATKMTQQIFHLKWKYIHTNLNSTLNNGFADFNSADVTLVSDDQIPFQAHRFVLSASSPVLKDLLMENPSSHPLIYLRGVDQQELGSILKVMYFGEATFNQNRINQFLNNSRELQMKHVTNAFVTRNNIMYEESELETENEMIENLKSLDNPEPITEYDESNKSISSTIDEILALDILTNNTTKYESDFENQLHKCEDCGAGYRQKAGLISHIQSKHNGIKYSCNLCRYLATTQGNLKLHKESQHGGVKYSCDQCKHQFTRKDNLKLHKKSQHEGVQINRAKSDLYIL